MISRRTYYDTINPFFLSIYVKVSVKKKISQASHFKSSPNQGKPKSRRGRIKRKPDNSGQAQNIAAIHEYFRRRVLCNTQGFGDETQIYEGLTRAGGLG